MRRRIHVSYEEEDTWYSISGDTGISPESPLQCDNDG
jgi:hypothetical protein